MKKFLALIVLFTCTIFISLGASAQTLQRSAKTEFGIKKEDPNKGYKECYVQCASTSKTKQEQEKCMARCNQQFTAPTTNPQAGPSLGDYAQCVSFCNDLFDSGSALTECIKGCSKLESLKSPE